MADDIIKGSVMLAACYGESIRPATWIASLAAVTFDRGRHIAGVQGVGNLYVADGRNRVVKTFLETTCEWLWFIDTDVEFPQDILYQLLAVADDDHKIIAAPYWNVDDDRGHFLTWFHLSHDAFHAYSHLPEGPLVRIDACGMGCTLIHRDVCLAITRAHENPHDPWQWYAHDLLEVGQHHIRAGEDFVFCLRGAAVGYATWGLVGPELKHYKLRPVTAPTKDERRLIVP